jgi:predicted DNA-binding transcriptional regulator AlpA
MENDVTDQTTDADHPIALHRLLTVDDLAERWGCSGSRIRNTPDADLPPKLRLPGSRLVRFRLADVLEFEVLHVDRAV